MLQSSQRGVNAGYFVGNRFVRFDYLDATPLGTLMRLQMLVGANAFEYSCRIRLRAA